MVPEDEEATAILYESINIYPNPTENSVRIEGTENITQIEIINTIGQVIAVIKNNGDAVMQVDLSGQANGLYLLRMRDAEENMVMKRVVKN